jgi:hypothetical protein
MENIYRPVKGSWCLHLQVQELQYFWTASPWHWRQNLRQISSNPLGVYNVDFNRCPYCRSRTLLCIDWKFGYCIDYQVWPLIMDNVCTHSMRQQIHTQITDIAQYNFHVCHGQSKFKNRYGEKIESCIQHTQLNSVITSVCRFLWHISYTLTVSVVLTNSQSNLFFRFASLSTTYIHTYIHTYMHTYKYTASRILQNFSRIWAILKILL